MNWSKELAWQKGILTAITGDNWDRAQLIRLSSCCWCCSVSCLDTNLAPEMSCVRLCMCPHRLLFANSSTTSEKSVCQHWHIEKHLPVYHFCRKSKTLHFISLSIFVIVTRRTIKQNVSKLLFKCVYCTLPLIYLIVFFLPFFFTFIQISVHLLRWFVWTKREK